MAIFPSDSTPNNGSVNLPNNNIQSSPPSLLALLEKGEKIVIDGKQANFMI
jgi:hypothetical protein